LRPGGEITLDGLAIELAEALGIVVHCGTVWQALRGLGLTHKTDLQALEQKRRDVVEQRRIWIAKRQPFMANHLERLAFIPSRQIALQSPAGQWTRHK